VERIRRDLARRAQHEPLEVETGDSGRFDLPRIAFRMALAMDPSTR
jgi:hypothetical protein